MNMKKYTLLLALLLVGVLTGYSQQSAYLFVYFTGNRMSEEAIRMAVSPDGYNYYALNGNQPVIDSREISSTGGVRDPHILRCEDGKTFYMVVTDMVSGNGWSSNRAMVLLKSKDLVNWTSNIVNIQKKYPNQEDLKREPHNRYMQIRLTEAEYEAIERKFRNSGLRSRSEFIRTMIFEGYIVNFDEEKFDKIYRLVGSIANNINQIAVRVNSTNKVYAEDIVNIKEGQDKIWQLLNSLQSKLLRLKR